MYITRIGLVLSVVRYIAKIQQLRNNTKEKAKVYMCLYILVYTFSPAKGF